MTESLRVARREAPDERRRSDGLAQLLVWGCWVAGLASALFLVLTNARNVPMREDYQLVPAFTGHQDGFLSWLWTENNEHRVPIPRLVYLGLLKLWPDFRVGMVFNIVLLAVIAAGFIIFLRRRRGCTRWTDAFFPVAFLNLGNWENMGWSWELQFVIATALACGLLGGIATLRPMTTRRAAWVGGCMVAIPLTGATALPFAPIVALALIPRLRRAAPRARAVSAACIAVTLIVTVVYFVGLRQPAWVSPPSPWATIETGAKSLALGLGPGAGAWWLLSALVVLALVAGAGVILFRTGDQSTWPLRAFLVAGIVLALEIGHSRSSLLPYYGLPDRYALIALPILCWAYIAYDRYGRGRWKVRGPALLCGAATVLLPLNIAYGFQYRDWYHNLVDPFAEAVRAGVPLQELAYYGSIGDTHWVDGMADLRQANFGVFARLQENGTDPAQGRSVDGFDTGGGGWSTLGGSASSAALQLSDGRTTLRWNYQVSGSNVPTLGRSFGAPEDWRDSGGLAITTDGQGSGRAVFVRVATESSRGTIDRYDASFSDAPAAPHTVVIPWSGFLHVNAAGDFDLQGPVALQRVVAVVFGVTGPGQGSLTIDRVALEPGQSSWGWPRHPAATRHSLPPWR